MAAFLEGILAGYGIAIPVGAIAVLIVDTALRRGFRLGFMAGAGAATADLLFAALAAIAGVALAARLAPFALSLRVASAVVLLGIGGYGLWRAWRASAGLNPKPGRTGDRGHVRTYGQFLGLTLLNPLTIAYFGALILGSNAGSTVTVPDRIAFVVGAGLASLSWQTLLAGTGALAKRYLSPRFRFYTSVVGSLVVCALGLRILVQLFR